MRFFLVYWKPSNINWENPSEQLLNHTAGNQLRKIKCGDVLYLITYKNKSFYLLGRVVADRVVGQKNAEQILNSDNLWQSKHHVIAAAPIMPAVTIPFTRTLEQIVLTSGDRIGRLRGSNSVQRFRMVREITIASACELDKLLKVDVKTQITRERRIVSESTENQFSYRVSDWRTEITHWVYSHKGIQNDHLESILRFFELAFENTRYPDRSWFGVHSQSISIVIGGIYLASICASGEKGFWLLVDSAAPSLDKIEYRTVSSTKKSVHTLNWAHSDSLDQIPALISDAEIWKSFSNASKMIIASSISSDRDSVQLKRGKKRVCEVRLESCPTNFQNDFLKAIQISLSDTSEVRKKRLEIAPTIPKKNTIVSEAFIRNPDVVAEVLHRANGYCEHCRKPAPFLRRSDKSPYLEVHHVKTLSEGGEDTVENAVALCPNCHRRAHYE